MYKNQSDQLELELRSLQNDLGRSSSIWNDKTRHQFESVFWDEINQSTQRYLIETQELIQLMDEIETWLR